MSRFTLLFFAFLFLSLSVQAQQFDQCMQVVATTGGQGSQSNRSLSWTVGEPVVNTLHSTNYALTQGFQQPDACGKPTVGTNDLTDWGIDVFPNPSEGWFTVRYSLEKQGALKASVYDLLGRPLLQAQNLDTAPGSMIDANAWPPGIYMLLLQDPITKSFATYRITRI